MTALSLSTRRVTPMAPPADSAPRINWPFAALLAFFAAEAVVMAVAFFWWLA